MEERSETADRTLTRREVLVRGGQLAAGLAAAGALAGPARAARLRRAATVPRGGHVTWAINTDPTALAPWGVLLEPAHWANEFIYD